MQYDSRLFTVAKLRKLAERCDDIANACTEANEALAQYEDAEDADDREDARTQAWDALGEILNEADALRALRDTLYSDPTP